MASCWREFVVEGPAVLVKGLVIGTLVAKEADRESVVFADECSIRSESWVEQLAEWIRLQPKDSHLLVREDVRESIVKVIEKTADLGVKLVSEREVQCARFDFSYRAYSKQHASEMDDVLQSVPGCLLPGYKTWLRHDPKAKGAELYSPIHEFNFSASGTAQGEIPAILELHRAVKKHDFIKAESIKISFC